MLLTGEPGIGKSRLTRALQERLERTRIRPLTYHCSPYHQDSALHPDHRAAAASGQHRARRQRRGEAGQARSLAGAIEREPRRRYASVRGTAVDSGW